MDTELFEHWFHSFAGSAGITLHVENLYGSNNHHIIESCFKAVARALRTAVEIDPRKADSVRSEEHTSELQSLMRISYAVFCLKKKNTTTEKEIMYRTIAKQYKQRSSTIHKTETFVEM